MKQQSLIYSFVARGTTVLADYTEFTGNFASVASQCLSKLPSSSNKFTYTSEGHTFNYLVDNNGFTYCVVATETIGRQVPIAFLERIKDEFIKKCGAKGVTQLLHIVSPMSLGPKLKEQMQYCVDHREELNKLAKVEARITEIKGVMVDNIEKVLDRGEKIEVLVDKTEDLRAQMMKFKNQGAHTPESPTNCPLARREKIDFTECIACSSLAMSTDGALIHRHVILFYSWDHPAWS